MPVPSYVVLSPQGEVLAIAGGIRAVQANAGSIYMALDRPQLASLITFVSLLLGLGSFTVALGYMPLAEATWFLVMGGAIAATINLSIVTRLLGLNWLAIFKPSTRPVLGIVAMASVLSVVRDPLWNAARANGAGGGPIALASLVLIGAVVYLAVVFFAWRVSGAKATAPEAAVLKTVKGALRRKRRPDPVFGTAVAPKPRSTEVASPRSDLS